MRSHSGATYVPASPRLCSLSICTAGDEPSAAAGSRPGRPSLPLSPVQASEATSWAVKEPGSLVPRPDPGPSPPAAVAKAARRRSPARQASCARLRLICRGICGNLSARNVGNEASSRRVAGDTCAGRGTDRRRPS